MRNKDIFTIERHLFIKNVPTHTPVRIRTYIRMDQVIDIGSALGLLALVVLALAW